MLIFILIGIIMKQVMQKLGNYLFNKKDKDNVKLNNIIKD